MKRIIILWSVLFLPSLLIAQEKLEDQLLSETWSTSNTISSNRGKWAHFATCEFSYGFQDFGTTFEILGNGSGNRLCYYGKLIARFKRQASTVGRATNWELVLFDSNIGAENIKAVRNEAKMDIYIRINNTYTALYFR